MRDRRRTEQGVALWRRDEVVCRERRMVVGFAFCCLTTETPLIKDAWMLPVEDS